jgi:sugar lactone lactonase YvrE
MTAADKLKTSRSEWVLMTVAVCLVAVLADAAAMAADQATCWPPAPAVARVQYDRQIRCGELDQETGFFGKALGFLSGKDPDARLARPFDVEIAGDYVYAVCRDLPALVRIDQKKGSYRLFRCSERPLSTPVSLARSGQTVYVSDSGSAAVYRFEGDELEPWITEGLLRPTGIAVLTGQDALCVVDTGDHRIKVYDSDGRAARDIGSRGPGETDLNFPTFATEAGLGILVNDTLNYRIKRFDEEGRMIASFGTEGDGPGTFARPKGVALDDAGNAWVVDGLFDNIQVFDSAGRLLMVVGGPGQAAGEFWSPTGIAASGSELFIADTYNDRIQVLQILGGGS